MTPQDEKEAYEKAYAKEKDYRHVYYHMSDYCCVPLAGRREVEDAVENLFNVLKKYDIHFGGRGDKPMEGVTDILLTHWHEPGGRPSVNISTHDSCWMSVLLEPTQEEMEEMWKSFARHEVERLKRNEKEEQEKAEFDRIAREKCEEMKREQEERARKLREYREEQERPMREFVEYVHEIVRGMIKRSNGWFAEEHCTKEQVDAINKYLVCCQSFSDAMNAGMSGLGLYPQNEARTNAHEEMLDEFGLGGSEYARRVTKDIDFIDTYDTISGKYAHNDADRVVDAMAWALKECQEKSGVV